MTRCMTCRHPEREVIEGRVAAGESAQRIATEFGLTKVSLGRHLKNHLHDDEERADAAAPGDDTALDELATALRKRALGGDTGAAREYRLALQALETSRAAVRPASELVTSSEWQALRAAILDALAPHPEAHAAVVAAVARLVKV